MKFASWFAVVLLSSVTFIAAEEAADPPAETGFVPPESWEEFVAFHHQSGEIGTWETRGKTVAMWEGIPAGLDYTARYGAQLAHDGQVIIYSHYMATATGQVISTGSGTAYWDAKSKTIKSTMVLATFQKVSRECWILMATWNGERKETHSTKNGSTLLINQRTKSQDWICPTRTLPMDAPH